MTFSEHLDNTQTVNHAARQEPLHAGTLYPLRLFMRCTGLGRAAMRAARNNGLRVHYVGGRAFVHADDFFTYLDERTNTNDSEES